MFLMLPMLALADCEDQPRFIDCASTLDDRLAAGEPAPGTLHLSHLLELEGAVFDPLLTCTFPVWGDHWEARCTVGVKGETLPKEVWLLTAKGTIEDGVLTVPKMPDSTYGLARSLDEALRHAVQADLFWICKELLAKGADPTTRNAEGRSAVDLARSRDDTRVVELLETHGKAEKPETTQTSDHTEKTDNTKKP